MPSIASHARRSSPNSVSISGSRSRPHELTFWPSSVSSLTPCRREPLHLGDDLARTAALLAAAHGRDDAVRALRVAAHRHLHPRLEGALVVHRQLRGEVSVVETEPSARDAHRRRRRATRRGARSSRGRTRRRPPGTARRSARAAPPRSSRRRRSRDPGCSRLRAAASPRYAASFVSGFSRIVQVLKTTTSASSGLGGLAEAELLEHALDPLGIVGVHLAAERGHVVAAHRCRVAAASDAVERAPRGGRCRRER